MDTVATIRTKVRPVKKLFIIGQSDLARLVEVVRLVSKEIAGLSNLVLINDQKLFLENTIGFVNRHDPDVIINYSSRHDDELSGKFKIPVFSGSRIDDALVNLSTPISIVDNLPHAMTVESGGDGGEFFSCLESEINDTFNLLCLLHFGIVNTDSEGFLEGSAFEEVKISPITSLEQFFHLVNQTENNFLYMTLALAGIGEGSSIWHLNFNPDDFFKKKPTIIFGKKNDVTSMVYFWNMRATYPYNKTIWFPVELLGEAQEHIEEFDYYGAFPSRELIGGRVEEDKLIELDCSRYYFGTYFTEWNTFECLQNISIVGGRARLSHPFEKLLSRMGFNFNFVLEVSGLKEFHAPKSLKLGELFVPLPENREAFPYYFARLSKLSLSIYSESFEPLGQTPLIQEISLPDTEAVFRALFNEHRLSIRETQGTRVANQVIDLLGGYEGIELLSNSLIFELLVKLTPPRTEKLVRALVARSQESEETELRELVERNIASLATIHSDLVVDIDQISSMLPILKEQRWRIYPLIQKLYERKILLRGKSFPCPHCKTILWYPLESIREENRCYGCNQYVSIPIFSGERVSGDHFKLNELMSNAVDQGLLPLILTVYFLSRQKFYMKRFIYNYEVHPLDYDEMLAEIDLIFTLGNRLGLSETKADRGFTSHQVDRLLDVANRMEADILLFSTLKGMDSEEVQSLVDYLRSKDLKIPAFIITREVLFEQSLVDLGPYFEVKRGDTRFPHGPIVIKIGKSV